MTVLDMIPLRSSSEFNLADTWPLLEMGAQAKTWDNLSTFVEESAPAYWRFLG